MATIPTSVYTHYTQLWDVLGQLDVDWFNQQWQLHIYLLSFHCPWFFHSTLFNFHRWSTYVSQIKYPRDENANINGVSRALVHHSGLHILLCWDMKCKWWSIIAPWYALALLIGTSIDTSRPINANENSSRLIFYSTNIGSLENENLTIIWSFKLYFYEENISNKTKYTQNICHTQSFKLKYLIT